MPKYVVSWDKKKGDESLNEFYEETTLGVIQCANAQKALQIAQNRFPGKKIAIVSVFRAPLFQQPFIKKARTISLNGRT